MPSPRRSALVAVLVLMAGFAFAACGRAQPGTAVYLGNTRYTEERIDALADEIGAASPGANRNGLRKTAVSALVLGELAKWAAEEKSLDVPEPDFAGTAQEFGLPEGSGLNRTIAELNANVAALARTVTPVSPTENDLRQIYDALSGSGQLQEGDTYEEIAAAMKSNTLLPQVLGLRNVLRDQIEKADVEVNPRYLPLITTFNRVPVVLAEGVGTVRQV